jgi:hypothetical protein
MKRRPWSVKGPVPVRGDVYPSRAAVARAFNVSRAAVSNAIRRGTLDRLGATDYRGKPCTVDGVSYPSRAAYGRAVGVSDKVACRVVAMLEDEA